MYPSPPSSGQGTLLHLQHISQGSLTIRETDIRWEWFSSWPRGLRLRSLNHFYDPVLPTQLGIYSPRTSKNTCRRDWVRIRGWKRVRTYLLELSLAVLNVKMDKGAPPIVLMDLVRCPALGWFCCRCRLRKMCVTGEWMRWWKDITWTSIYCAVEFEVNSLL